MGKRPNKNKYRYVLKRLEIERFQRRLVSDEKRKIRFRARSGHFQSRFEVREKIRGLPTNKGWANLRVPPILDLIANFEEAAEFVKSIRRTALGERRKVRLLFDEVKQIRPAALLLLLAEIHHCRLTQGLNRVTGTYPTNKRLERMMDATGFFKLLGVASRILKPKNSTRTIEYIEFVSDVRLARDAARKLRQSLLGEELSMNLLSRKKLFRAISEAMINVGQHAYPDELHRGHQIRGRWWLAGAINKPRNELMVTFCDLGVGIPRTLPKLYTWEKIRSALSLLPGINPNDGEMIQAGMTIGRTQTGETNRGKGLNDLRSFIDQSGTGEMVIISQHGMYRYTAGGVEKAQNYGSSVGGTFIKWTVPLDRVTNWTGEVGGYGEDEND